MGQMKAAYGKNLEESWPWLFVPASFYHGDIFREDGDSCCPNVRHKYIHVNESQHW